MKRARYTVLLVPDPDVEGFTATVPEIPEIVTEGDDEAHALAMTREAIALYLGYVAERGLPASVERATPRLASVDVEARTPTGIAGPGR